MYWLAVTVFAVGIMHSVRTGYAKERIQELGLSACNLNAVACVEGSYFMVTNIDILTGEMLIYRYLRVWGHTIPLTWRGQVFTSADIKTPYNLFVEALSRPY